MMNNSRNASAVVKLLFDMGRHQEGLDVFLGTVRRLLLKEEKNFGLDLEVLLLKKLKNNPPNPKLILRVLTAMKTLAINQPHMLTKISSKQVLEDLHELVLGN